MRICRIRLVTELAKRNLTSQTLAKQAGVSKATISAIKNGRSCSPDTAAKIANALNMNIDDLKEKGGLQNALNEFLNLLKGVTGNGNQYKARCPAHEDKNPSLSVSTSNGKILLHCHARCDTEKILGALGIEMKDLNIETKPVHANGQSDITAVYDYRDLDGKIIHSTVRYTPKKFLQRRPDPNNPDRFIWKDVFNGITPLLYNLSAVTNAIKEKQPVLVVEGEKDCNNLDKYGFTALPALWVRVSGATTIPTCSKVKSFIL